MISLINNDSREGERWDRYNLPRVYQCVESYNTSNWWKSERKTDNIIRILWYTIHPYNKIVYNKPNYLPVFIP